ncbi:hypothetical protein [Couchioplanes caeruleus]|uniref:DUF4383 domain-containing protein n=2 Tax=Couchioplanes caeruleus TaxID=56438 RepID=A0A1K0FSB0_9ACTN|nr:hypothetical protein [Couchioplanes caeruleus]OJF15159.1 hypothetical protein BG844_05915 [Couchioplanes caeruleus subsp. caeruleus]OJF15717.1 hypothetical protein BG844_03035 [Couchioplanes caeruleus subsp. caeruleus]ROP31853.1 hypothetical protein EDD30_4779 [Couchioplanes caeruleus]
MAHYPVNHHLRQTYRLFAGASGAYLALVGVVGVGVTWGDPFFHRGHDWVLGLRTNPAGAWLTALLGLAVLVAVLLGGNVHHHGSLVTGWGLLGVSMVLLALIQTDANVLNVSMVNVIVLTLLGLVVLTAGLYGKVDDSAATRADDERAHQPA